MRSPRLPPQPLSRALLLADLAERSQAAVAARGLRGCSLASVPPGEQRRLRRHPDGVTAALDITQPPARLAADVIDAVLAAERLKGPAAAELRGALAEALGPALAEVEDPADLAGLSEAYRTAVGSPDPSTQNGALLTAADGRCVAAANDFPPGVEGTPERWAPPEKYRWVVHAETGVLLAAARAGVPTAGATVHVPWFACLDCARDLVTAGVGRLVGHAGYRREAAARAPHWSDSIAEALDLLVAAGVATRWIDAPLPGAPAVRIAGSPWDPARWTPPPAVSEVGRHG